MIEAIEKLTEDMRGKVRLMVGRAILAAIGDGGPIQTAQARLLADEVHDDMERVQEYGFTSVPLPGAEGVAVFVGGNRDHGLIVATDDRRYRKKGLQGGEVALYTDEGDSIVLNRGRIVRVVAGAHLEVTAPLVTIKASSKVRLETPLVEITGQLTVAGGMAISGGGTTAAITGNMTINGNVVTTGTITNNGKSIDSTHVHTGVTPGGSNTGTPA